jgi:phospholipase C
VPAFVVSPFTAAGERVRTPVYDHTSVIKTILLRFCQKNGQIPNMGARVANANHLGDTLSLAQPRPPTPRGLPRRRRPPHVVARRGLPGPPAREADGGPADPADLNDLQQQVLAANAKIRAECLRSGSPSIGPSQLESARDA